MFVSHHHITERNRCVKVANKLFENVTKFKYLGTTVRNQNFVRGEIMRTLNSGNACYYTVQNLLYSCHQKIKLLKLCFTCFEWVQNLVCYVEVITHV
jgi:hypothetical protein